MKELLFSLLLIATGFIASGQVNTEKVVQHKIDSLILLLDTNDARFEERAEKLMKDFANSLQTTTFYDTIEVIGNDHAERIIADIEMLVDKEQDSTNVDYEFTEQLPYLYIDLGKDYNKFNVEDAGSFQNLQILIIRGNGTSSNFDVSNLFTLIESLPVSELYITNCGEGVTFVPDNIGNLTSLKKLGLYGNKITSLPGSLCNLNSLEVLYLDANPITALPAGMEKLKKLNTLGIAKTKINATEINRIKNILPQCNILTQ